MIFQDFFFKIFIFSRKEMWIKTFRVFLGLLTSLYCSQIPIIACLAITFLDFNIFLSKFFCSFLSSTFQIVEGLISIWIFSSYKQTFSCHLNALIFFFLNSGLMIIFSDKRFFLSFKSPPPSNILPLFLWKLLFL